MFIVATSSIAVLLVSIFPCQPLAMSWDLDLANGPGHCIDRKALYEATAAFGVAVDLTIIALPVPLVIAMRVSAVQRMGILLLFTLGSASVSSRFPNDRNLTNSILQNNHYLYSTTGSFNI